MHLTAQITLLFLMLMYCTTPVHAQSITVDSVVIRLIDEVDVPARALGAITELHAEEGTHVQTEQLLAQIDATEAQLKRQLAEFEVAIARHQADNDVTIRSAQKSMAFAQADFARLRKADKDRPRSVSKSELERAKLDADQAALDLERAQSDLDLAKIKQQLAESELALAERDMEIRRILAPVKGVVVKVLNRPGEWVKPGDPIFRIVRIDRLRAEGFVEASDVWEDFRGAPVTLELELTPGAPKTFSGKIVFVSPEIDPVNGQVRVWADVDNSSGRLRPGLRALMVIHRNLGQE